MDREDNFIIKYKYWIIALVLCLWIAESAYNKYQIRILKQELHEVKD